VSGQASTILASGRVTQDLPSFLQILADVLEAPVVPVTTKRATLRGTALLALEVLAPEVERAAPATGETLAPVPERAEYYRGRQEAYQGLYASVVG
jgi:gluconokinase